MSRHFKALLLSLAILAPANEPLKASVRRASCSNKVRILGSAALLGAAIGSGIAVHSKLTEPPVWSLYKGESTPDFFQRDPAFELVRGGTMACGPCAAANGVFWLGQNGFPNLLPEISRWGSTEKTVIKELFYKTGVLGNSPEVLMKGLRKYVAESGYSATISYDGWTDSEKSIPDIREIKRAIHDPKAFVLLNVGWYRHMKERDEYVLDGSHWVTAVGYGMDSTNNLDANSFVIHDPWTKDKKDEFWKLEKLQSGSISEPAIYFALPGDPAKNQYKLGSGILKGAIILKMN